MQNPLISIVVPSFNKVKYIGQTLESIVNQNYQNLEVIIQDGGSTDGTLAVIKKFARKYPGIFNFESKKDKGQLDAINTGLKKATGEILTYINADDTYGLGALDSVAKAYMENPSSLWFAGRGRVINSKGKEIAKFIIWYKNLLLSLNSRLFLLAVNYLMQPSVFITRKAWEKFGSFIGTQSYITEYDLWLRLSRVSMPRVISECISSFRISGENISSVSYVRLLDDDYIIAKKYTKNMLILALHKLNNLARIAVVRHI